MDSSIASSATIDQYAEAFNRAGALPSAGLAAANIDSNRRSTDASDDEEPGAVYVLSVP